MHATFTFICIYKERRESMEKEKRERERKSERAQEDEAGGWGSREKDRGKQKRKMGRVCLAYENKGRKLLVYQETERPMKSVRTFSRSFGFNIFQAKIKGEQPLSALSSLGSDRLLFKLT
jgi:hypothetical protein